MAVATWKLGKERLRQWGAKGTKAIRAFVSWREEAQKGERFLQENKLKAEEKSQVGGGKTEEEKKATQLPLRRRGGSP